MAAKDVDAALQEYGARLMIWHRAKGSQSPTEVYLKRLAAEAALRKLDVALLGYDIPCDVLPRGEHSKSVWA